MHSRRTKTKPPRGRPRCAAALSPAERMRRMRARRKAEGLKPVVRWVPGENAASGVYSSHRLHDARSLAMHVVITEKIQRDPRLLEIARSNLARWRDRQGSEVPRWMSEWREILARPWNEIAAVITEPSEEGARLRQSTPFAGVLTAAERKRIYEAFRA